LIIIFYSPRPPRTPRPQCEKKSLRGDEIVAQRRQLVGSQSVDFQVFNVDVVVRSVDMLQGQVGGIAPSVGFTPEEGDALNAFRLSDKRREIRGQGGHGQLVH